MDTNSAHRSQLVAAAAAERMMLGQEGRGKWDQGRGTRASPPTVLQVQGVQFRV
jgi:hypothetical protein